MATSTCIKCNSSAFELKLNEPHDSRYKFFFVQCRSCGGVVGVTDYYATSTLLEKIAEKLGVNLYR